MQQANAMKNSDTVSTAVLTSMILLAWLVEPLASVVEKQVVSLAKGKLLIMVEISNA